MDLPLFNISRRVADELLAGTGKTIDQLEGDINASGAPRSMPIPGVSVEARRAIKDRRVVQTRNVVGVIEGSDRCSRTNTCWCRALRSCRAEGSVHLPRRRRQRLGDRRVLAIAEAFRALPAPPKRSVMFLVFEAEEDGLLARFHYITHPIVPLDRTVAVLNMDMIGRDEDSPTWNTHAADNVNGVNLIGTCTAPTCARRSRPRTAPSAQTRLQDRRRRS